jgi:antirestriction protein ArdC
MPTKKSTASSVSAKKYLDTYPKRDDFADMVASFFIKAIQDGTAPWMKPWKADHYLRPQNLSTGKPYHGFNAIWLEYYAQAVHKSDDPRWMTFLQIRDAGYHLQKGSKSVPIQYFDQMPVGPDGKRVKDDHEAVSYRLIRKYYNVFHASQIDGIPPLQIVDTL